MRAFGMSPAERVAGRRRDHDVVVALEDQASAARCEVEPLRRGRPSGAVPTPATARYCASLASSVTPGVAPLLAPEDPAEGRLAGALAGRRGGVEDIEQRPRRRAGHCSTRRSATSCAQATHAGGALGTGPGEDQPAHHVGSAEGDRLRDEPAERETEQVDLIQPHRVDECDGVLGHLLHGARRGAGGCPDADIVEQDHVAFGRDRIDQCRIPVVDVTTEVLQEDQRARPRPNAAEAAIGVPS